MLMVERSINQEINAPVNKKTLAPTIDDSLKVERQVSVAQSFPPLEAQDPFSTWAPSLFSTTPLHHSHLLNPLKGSFPVY